MNQLLPVPLAPLTMTALAAAIAGLACIAAPAFAQQTLMVAATQEQAVKIQRSESDVNVTRRDAVPVQRRVQQDLLRRESDNKATAQRAQRQAQQAFEAPSATPPAESATAATPAEAQQAAARNEARAAAVDDRPLWKLLQAKNLPQFDRQLASLRINHPEWTPSAALRAERDRQQVDADIDLAFAQASATATSPARLDALQYQVKRRPEQFSCARIDRLWKAAELFAAAGQPEVAANMYRTVFPDCTPAANRVATLFMAQQALGAQSPAVTELIGLEEQGGKRDADSDAKFVRLKYDRALTRLAAIDPAAEEGAVLAKELAPQIEAYQDASAATLTGWILLAHQQDKDAEVWFTRAAGWAPDNIDAQLGLLQIRLAGNDLAGAQALLAQPKLAADPRAKAQRSRLALLQADALNKQKDYAGSMKALDDAERLGASKEQTAQLRGWNLYGSSRYAQSAAVFAEQYRSTHDARVAEGWALSENARGKLDKLADAPEAKDGPLQPYVTAMQSQQLYYRKQFVEANALKKETQQAIAQQQEDKKIAPDAAAELRESVATYLPEKLNGIDAPSVTTGLTYSNHAGAAGQGHLETFTPAIRAEWFGGQNNTRQYNLRYRRLMLDAGTVSPDAVAQAIGVPAGATASGKVNGQDLWFSVDDSFWVTDMGRFNWQGAVGVTDGGVGSTDLSGQATVGQQTAWGNWQVYGGSNPVRDSLLSWRGLSLPGSGAYWGNVKRNAIGARTLVQVDPDWSVSANAELAQFSGQNVQGNRAIVLDLGAGYNLKPAGFDYFNVGPALHYLRYDNNQNQYGWGLGGYYSPQRSVSAGIASQFLTLEGRDRQISGNLELGWNTSSQSAASCLPAALPAPYAASSSSGVNCGYGASSDKGMYAHMQMAVVKRLGQRWQVGVLGDLNVTPGRDRQYAAMLFVRYFFADRDAVFSRDLPKNTRDFFGQMDDGR